jgi:hypothetical protein
MSTCAAVRDLYQAIGASPDDDAHTLGERAGQVDDDALCDDVYAVLLLDDDRRAAYDRIHRRLHDIGGLRAELGLTDSPQWPGRTAHDFTPQPRRAPFRRPRRILLRAVRWLAISLIVFSVLQAARMLTGGS